MRSLSNLFLHFLLIGSFFFIPSAGQAQADEGEALLFKGYPVMPGLQLSGFILAVEKTIDTGQFGIQAAFKYFAGATLVYSNGTLAAFPAYARLEIQGRWYPGRLARVFYLSPLLSINHRGQPAAGIVMGGQKVIARRIPLDFNIGIQSAAPLDRQDFGSFLRIRLGAGYYLKQKKRKDGKNKH